MALEGAGGLLYATLFRHNAGNLGKKLCYPTKFREFAKIYCKTDRGGGYNVCRQDSRTLRGLDDETGGNKMKWVKRFAAGFLAAAMSLALLCGCSGGGGGSIDPDTTQPLEFKDSLLCTTRTYWCGAISGFGWALKGTDQTGAKTLVAVSKNQNVSYVGTEKSGIMKVVDSAEYKVRDKSNNLVPAGFYEVDRTKKTYRSADKMGAVEQVITSMLLSYGSSTTNKPIEENIPNKMESATATRDGKEYYVEKAEYACGTAVIYYQITNEEKNEADVKYVDIYLPGQSKPQAQYKVTEEEYNYHGGTAMVSEYGGLLGQYDKVD